jgi:hypothetical protein
MGVVSEDLIRYWGIRYSPSQVELGMVLIVVTSQPKIFMNNTIFDKNYFNDIPSTFSFRRLIVNFHAPPSLI